MQSSLERDSSSPEPGAARPRRLKLIASFLKLNARVLSLLETARLGGPSYLGGFLIQKLRRGNENLQPFRFLDFSVIFFPYLAALGARIADAAPQYWHSRACLGPPHSLCHAAVRL